MPENLSLSVKILSPDELVWEGQAEWVSSINSKGPFDILPLHSNFITIIEGKPIRIKSGKDIKEYTFSRSVLYTHDNKVYIYVNI